MANTPLIIGMSSVVIGAYLWYYREEDIEKDEKALKGYKQGFNAGFFTGGGPFLALVLIGAATVK